MKVLWITNSLLPEAVALLTNSLNKMLSGGWLLGAAEGLLRDDSIELSVASVSPLVTDLRIIEGERIKYYILPVGKGNTHYNSKYEPLWTSIKNDYKPDVVHIHGSEFTHGLAYVRACGCENVVVSIQGLVSEIGLHYIDGLSKFEIYKNFTLHDVLRQSTLVEQENYLRRGILERDLFRSVKYAIGRTEWDKSHVTMYNPQLQYYKCNESLRQEFYTGSWCYEKCDPLTIFLSQSYYSLKGLHQVLKALPEVIKRFPDTKVRIVGKDISMASDFRSTIERTGYGKLIANLIRKNKLGKYIEFLGPLTAEHMKAEYLSSNVFVCPSAIENSSNSIAEAQILGTPVIASYAGGNPSMMKGCEDFMYRFEDTINLAYLIMEAFSNRIKTADVMQVRKRHDRAKNSETLLEIYNHILDR